MVPMEPGSLVMGAEDAAGGQAARGTARCGATVVGLPVEQPSEHPEGVLANYEQLKADLALLERFDPRALPKADAEHATARPGPRAVSARSGDAA